MHPSLREVLYWAACWIAAICALLALAAWLTDSYASWIGAGTFAAVSVAIWVLGRIGLWLAALRQSRRSP